MKNAFVDPLENNCMPEQVKKQVLQQFFQFLSNIFIFITGIILRIFDSSHEKKSFFGLVF